MEIDADHFGNIIDVFIKKREKITDRDKVINH